MQKTQISKISPTATNIDNSTQNSRLELANLWFSVSLFKIEFRTELSMLVTVGETLEICIFLHLRILALRIRSKNKKIKKMKYFSYFPKSTPMRSARIRKCQNRRFPKSRQQPPTSITQRKTHFWSVSTFHLSVFLFKIEFRAELSMLVTVGETLEICIFGICVF